VARKTDGEAANVTTALDSSFLSSEPDSGKQNPHDVPGGLYPLAELPKRHWMMRRNGKPLNKWTVLRWAIHGRRGRKLRTLMIGGTRCTCDVWAMQFFEYLTAATDPAPVAAPTPLRRERQIAKVDRQLEALGL
jgi:hypothetical protein